MKTERVTEQELKSAKLAMKNSILAQNEAGVDKIRTLSSSISTSYGINRENELLDVIDSITADDIYNAANYIFSGKPIYSIVATENTLKANKEYLDSLVC